MQVVPFILAFPDGIALLPRAFSPSPIRIMAEEPAEQRAVMRVYALNVIILFSTLLLASVDEFPVAPILRHVAACQPDDERRQQARCRQAGKYARQDEQSHVDIHHQPTALGSPAPAVADLGGDQRATAERGKYLKRQELVGGNPEEGSAG